MKRILLLVGILSVGTILQAQTVFQKAISIPFSSAAEVSSITPCSDGGYIFSTTQGYSSAGIMKVDANGMVSWSKNFYSDSMSILTGFCAGECNGGGYYFLGGSYDLNYEVNNFMVRMDASGNTQWTKEFQANLEYEGTPSVFQATNGDFLISTMGMEMGLTRLSSNGNIIYQKRFGLDTTNSSKVPPMGAAMGSDGGVLICSFMTGLGLVKTDGLGNIQWTKDYYDTFFQSYYYPTGIIATNDGGFVIAGIDYNNNNPFLIKIDAGGNIIWRKLFSNPTLLFVTGLSQAPNGNLQIVGVDYYYSHAFEAQFDGTGNFLSAGIIGNPTIADDNFTTLAIHSCSDNGMIIGGLCQNLITASTATSIFKTDASGNLGCQYSPITLTDISGTFTAPADAQTMVYQMNVTGAVNQHAINSNANSPIEIDFCSLFSTNDPIANEISISAFPSPIASGENLQLTISGMDGASTIFIYNASGKVVKEFNQELSQNETTAMEIPTTNFSQGIYLVRIIGEDQEVLGLTKFMVR